VAPVPGPAATRWRKLVTARLGEMERLQPGRGALNAGFWDTRAKRFAKRLPVSSVAGDPLYRRLRQATGRRSTVLDIGAGTGRFSLALAPHVGAVTAVDPARRMLDVCRRQVAALGLANVTLVHATWEDADVEPADVAFSSYVVTLVADGARFLAKMDAAATQRAFLYLGAYTADAIMDPLWRHFHGAPRKPGPSYLDAADVLRELGVKPAIEGGEVPTRGPIKSIADAAKDYRDQLCLPDTPEIRKELRSVLQHWLIRRGDALGVPLKTVPAAVISWTPTAK
jgi:SAM-dependent methyltransferase